MQFLHSDLGPPATALPQTARPVMSFISLAACILLTLLAISAVFPGTFIPAAPAILD